MKQLWLIASCLIFGCSPSGDSHAAADAAPALELDAAMTFATAPHRRIPPATHQSSGGTLSAMRLVTVVMQGDPLADQLFAFGDVLIASQWFQSWATDYGIAPPAAHLRFTAPALASGTQLDRAAVASYLDTAGVPPPDGKTFYMLYLPSDVILVLGQQANTNCRIAGGYHMRYHMAGDGFGVVQRCPPKAGETQLDRVTLIGSHEIAEGASDTGLGWGVIATPRTTPWTSSVWAENEGSGNAEIADLCAGARIREAGYQFQRIFSNPAAATNGDPCMPAVTATYYSVDAASDWVVGTPGASVAITLNAWSTAPAEDWAIRSAIVGSSDAMAGATAVVASPTTGTFGQTVLPTTNNGRNATLTIKIPAGATSGSWVAVELSSQLVDANGSLPAIGDLRHLAMAGAYVP